MLDDLVRDCGDDDGFEGNAQSFRIITRLSAHRPTYGGLNLTRATLNAVLKYPWLRGQGPEKESHKFGAYQSDLEDFKFARGKISTYDKCLEAQIMDHADAVAYSVNDLDDFWRAGLIPLENLRLRFKTEFNLFVKSRTSDSERRKAEGHIKEVEEIAKAFPLGTRYDGSFRHRINTQVLSSRFIGRFLAAASLVENNGRLELHVPYSTLVQMKFLQNLVWRYVIVSPRLALQQHGQKHIIATLFNAYKGDMDNKEPKLIGSYFRHRLGDAALAGKAEIPWGLEANSVTVKSRSKRRINASKARLAADIVAGFSDNQAVTVYRRITGVNPGSVTDLIDS